MSLTPRIDSLESTTGGLSTQLATPAVKLTYLTAVDGTPGAGQFRSSVRNRAPMVDVSNDLMPRMGIQRIIVQQLELAHGESGPNSEVVYRAVNDKFEQIRFIREWASFNNTVGPHVIGGPIIGGTDVCEITFYGTGLNILAADYDGARDARATIDGGAEGGNSMGHGTVNTILQSRNYGIYGVVNVASGLTLGLHTIKLRRVTWLRLHGFEILNEATTIKVPTGTAAINGSECANTSVQSISYNSDFESGTLGTKGGRVLMYMKPDGTIGKALTPTDVSTLTNTSTDHTNEEVIRTYYWREFGAGRSDDYTTLTTVSTDRLFTLDDNTTSMTGSGNAGFITNSGGVDILRLAALNNYCIFTFIGTGLDIVVNNSATGGPDTFTFSIDGATPVTFSSTGTGTTTKIHRIVSGLPYGTHTVRFQRTLASNTYDVNFISFVTYGPKKPTLPSGTVELADYYIMGNYAFASGTTRVTSSGVLRKMGTREMIYVGAGWNISEDVDSHNNGNNIRTSGSGDFVEYTFWGTGVELRFYGNASSHNATLSIDGGTNFTGFTVNTSLSGTLAFAAGTGLITGTGGGNLSSISVTGLALGLHKVRLTRNAPHVSDLYFDSFDVVTPIHSPGTVGPFSVQSTLTAAHGSMNDRRSFLSSVIPKVARGVNMRAIAAQQNVGNVVIPSSYLQTAFVSTGKPILISYTIASEKDTALTRAVFQMYIDGVTATTDYKETYISNGNCDMVTTITQVVKLTPGVHYVSLSISGTTSGLLSVFANSNLLIQEMSGE